MQRGLLSCFCYPPLLGVLIGTGLIHFVLPLLVGQLILAIWDDRDRNPADLPKSFFLQNRINS